MKKKTRRPQRPPAVPVPPPVKDTAQQFEERVMKESREHTVEVPPALRRNRDELFAILNGQSGD